MACSGSPWHLLDGQFGGPLCLPSPALEEKMYPLPSTFGYTQVHHSQGIANGCLEHSRDAFFPLISSLSYFIYFLNFPAINVPLLCWWKPSQASASLSTKRLSPNMSALPSKRPCTEGSVEGKTNAKGIMVNEGSFQEKPPIRGYEDGYYWHTLIVLLALFHGLRVGTRRLHT